MVGELLVNGFYLLGFGGKMGGGLVWGLFKR